MVKVARGMAEDARVRVRGVRREAMEKIKAAEKGGSITEDDQKLYEKDVQKMTDAGIAKIDQILEKKEGEIMTV
jgi:ribosome recycling factor